MTPRRCWLSPTAICMHEPSWVPACPRDPGRDDRDKPPILGERVEYLSRCPFRRLFFCHFHFPFGFVGLPRGLRLGGPCGRLLECVANRREQLPDDRVFASVAERFDQRLRGTGELAVAETNHTSPSAAACGSAQTPHGGSARLWRRCFNRRELLPTNPVISLSPSRTRTPWRTGPGGRSELCLECNSLRTRAARSNAALARRSSRV